MILKACKYEREQRYPSMHLLSEALERRIAEMPPDPAGLPSLAAQLLSIPMGPPEWVDEASGVDELVAALAAAEEEAETTVSTLSAISAPPDSMTPVPAPIPYRMPPKGAHKPRRPGSLPSYLDEAAMFVQPPRRVKIDDNGAVAASVEADVEEGADGSGHSAAYWSVLATGGAMAALFALVFTGLLFKTFASYQLWGATTALYTAVTEERAVITDLADLGADERQLTERFFAFEDAPAAERATAAVAFVQLVEAEAGRVEAHDLALAHTSQLSRALRQYRSAKARQEAAASSLIGQLTGSIGLY